MLQVLCHSGSILPPRQDSDLNLEEAAAWLEDLVPCAALGGRGKAGGPIATAAFGFPLGGRQPHLPAVVPQLGAPARQSIISQM